MKTVANAVVSAFCTVTFLLQVWVLSVGAGKPLKLDLDQIIWLSVANVVLGACVTGIMGYSWARGKPYLVSWLHLGFGTAALGVTTSSLWLLLISLGLGVGPVLRDLLLWGGAFFWIAGAVMMMKWVLDPSQQKPKG